MNEVEFAGVGSIITILVGTICYLARKKETKTKNNGHDSLMLVELKNITDGIRNVGDRIDNMKDTLTSKLEKLTEEMIGHDRYYEPLIKEGMKLLNKQEENIDELSKQINKMGWD